MSPQDHETPLALIVLNPVAGLMNTQVLKLVIENRFQAAGWATQFLFTEKGMNVQKTVSEKLDQGFDLIVAVGGDGTISSVAAGMMHSSIPLGIIPAGTWNAIARHLRIPFNPLRAISMMIGRHQVCYLDLMSLGESVRCMNLSVGFSAMMIKTTSRANKRKFGNLAYLVQLFQQVLGLQMRRYTITADGKVYKGRATEIMVANYGVVGLNPIENLLEIHPDDGKADVLLLKTRTILDLPYLFWHILLKREKRTPKFQQLRASQTLTIETNPPMDVQSDGEMVGKTPVTITVIPRCVKVIVPQKGTFLQVPILKSFSILNQSRRD